MSDIIVTVTNPVTKVVTVSGPGSSSVVVGGSASYDVISNRLIETGSNLESLIYQVSGAVNTGSFYPRVGNPSGFVTGQVVRPNETGAFITSGQTGQFYSSSNPNNYITGFNSGLYVLNSSTGNFITTGQTGLFYSSANPSGYITSSQTGNFVGVNQTGYYTGIFYPMTGNPSGFVYSSTTGNFLTVSQTGGFVGINQTGYYTGIFYPMIGNPSGFAYASLTGNFITTSQTGQFASIINLGITGNTISLWTGISTGLYYPYSLNPSNYVTGQIVRPSETGIFITSSQTGQFYASSNPSSYITGFDSGSYVLKNDTGNYSNIFYPLNSNPSNYITSSQTGGFATTGYISSNYYPLNSNPSGYVTSSQTGNFTVLSVTGSANRPYSILSGIGGTNLYASGNFVLFSGGGSVDISNLTGCRNTQFGITLDAGSSILSSGYKGHFRIPRNITAVGWEIVGNATGYITIDIWKTGFANLPPTNSVAGAQKPSLSGQIINSTGTLNTWNTSFNQGDYVGYNVESGVSGLSRIALTIYGLSS